MKSNLFLELVRVSIGNSDKLSHTPSAAEWEELFVESQKQSIAGFIFNTLDNLSKKGQKIPSALLFEWFGLTEQIKRQNLLINQKCDEVIRIFADGGFKSCILKGQGNSAMYPIPLLRTSGDIDIWVDGKKDDIIRFVKKSFPYIDTRASAHHVEYPVFDNVEVEVHYMPTYSILRRLQSKMDMFIKSNKEEQFDNQYVFLDKKIRINVPTSSFNIVFQTSHMQRHFFISGLGLRHIIDFYYLLKYSFMKVNSCDVVEQLSELGLLKFAQGVMWILNDILGLDEKYLITKSDKSRGTLILDEILKGGNFGHYDQRFSKKIRSKSATLSSILRNMRMISLFPEEAVSAPITSVIRRFF